MGMLRTIAMVHAIAVFIPLDNDMVIALLKRARQRHLMAHDRLSVALWSLTDALLSF